MKALPFRGHQETWQTLSDLLKRERLSHALLLTGPKGIGKGILARHLAQSILCQAPSRPCGACPACHLVDEAKHPDLLLLAPDGERIKIDAVRDIIRNLSFSPLMGKERVVLIDEAHTMNVAAANALLKTLEEPPPHSYFILVTHAQGWVPRTIVSRCQVIRCQALSEAEISSILKEQGVEVQAKVLQEAMGSVSRALTLAGTQDLTSDLKHLLDPKGMTAAQAYHLAQSVVEEEKLEPFLESLLSEAHQKLRSSSPGEELNFDLLCFTDKILELRRRLRVNINAKLALHRLLLFFREGRESRLEI